MTGSAALPLKGLLRSLIPYALRVRFRALLEPGRVDPHDVSRVRELTTAQWRTLGERSPRYADAYWDRADEPGSDTVGKRRSEWLADLPPFREAGSVIELGCGVGRNLYVLQQRYPHLELCGVDISPAALAHARCRVRGKFLAGDLYDLDALLSNREADLIFTMGVLIHLHPDALPALIDTMRRRARRHLVFVEQVSLTNEVVKGPARWLPSRRVTGDYIQWSPNLSKILGGLDLRFEFSQVPPAAQSNGARHLFIVSLAQ
jgi:SAM-dependent methyltransferase